MPPAQEELNRPNIPEIHTIVGGFAGGGESNWARKAYVSLKESSKASVHESYSK
jgi:hypothetical protein